MSTASTSRQLELFPGSQSVWDGALLAVERFDLTEALEQLRDACERGDERESFDSMTRAVEWLALSGLDAQSSLEQLAAALWETPEWVRVGELSSAAAVRVEECLAKRIVFSARATRTASASGDASAVARAHLLLGSTWSANDVWLERIGVGAPDARAWAAQADVWCAMGHEDAKTAYARALALEPESLEPRWIRDEQLRDLLNESAREAGFELARIRLLPDAWLLGLIELPRREVEFGHALRRLRTELNTRPACAERDARSFALLLAEDQAFDDGEVERREAMRALDPERFSQVMAKLRRQETNTFA